MTANENTGSYLSCASGNPSAGKTGLGSATEVFPTLDHCLDEKRDIVQQLNTHLLSSEHVPTRQCDSPQYLHAADWTTLLLP